MASPTASDHRAAQAAFVSLIADLIARAWDALFDPHDLKGSTPKLAAAVEAIVTHYGRASSAAALDFYRSERRATGVPGRPSLNLSPVAPTEDVRAAVERALHPLYGPVTPEAIQTAQNVLTSETEQMVLDQSRGTLVGAVEADREAKGWARVTEPGACSFCRLLATRGAIYKTETSGDFRAHHKQSDGSGGTCRCHVEPTFTEYEPTAQARQDLADYRDLTEKYGKSGRDILIAWRQHVEGRPVTGPLVKPYRRSS